MSRIGSLLFALLLLAALIIALDPQARQKAAAAVQDLEPTLKKLDDRIVVNAPTLTVPGQSSTPMPTSTPFPTATADPDEQIPVTGDEDSSDEPIIQVNWDALGDALREFWVNLRNVKIDTTPGDNK